MNKQVIQGFEHQLLRVGDRVEEQQFEEAHWKELVRIHPSLPHPYYTLAHRGIRLSHYVGVLSTSFFNLEVLPKADAHIPTPVWRQVLVDMLVESGYWHQPASATDTSSRAHSLSDQWLLGFLDEVFKLCQRGLIRQYRMVETNTRALKGRLLFTQQIRHNIIRQDRFVVRHQTFTAQHNLHQLLKQALILVPQVSTHPIVQQQAHELLAYFAQVTVRRNVVPDLPQIYHRRTEAYRTAVTAAHQLLTGHFPHIYHGHTQQGFAVLVDMNQLFETFIYERLRRLSKRLPFTVRRQHSRKLWGDTQVRPDIIVEYLTKDQRIIIDTKWKVLSQARPSASDLHQLYVYNQLFSAKKGVLLYPQVYGLSPTAQRFNGPSQSFAEVNFVPIADERRGKLHPNLDETLLQMVAP